MCDERSHARDSKCGEAVGQQDGNAVIAGVSCNEKSRESGGKVRMRLGLWSQSGSDRKRVALALREECAAQRPSKCKTGVKNEVARVAKTAGGVWRESWSSRDHGEQAAEGQSAMRWDARVGCAVKPPDERCAGERVRDWRGYARWLQSGLAVGCGCCGGGGSSRGAAEKE